MTDAGVSSGGSGSGPTRVTGLDDAGSAGSTGGTGVDDSGDETTGELSSCAPLFEDDFDGPTLNPLWEVTANELIEIDNGELQFHVGTLGSEYAGLVSPQYNAEGISMLVEVVSVPQLPYSQFFIAFDLIDSPELLTMYIEADGQLSVRHWTTVSRFTQLAGTAWSPGDRFIRIREAAGQVIFEKSTDGIAFSDVYVYERDIRAWTISLDMLCGSYDNNPSDEIITVASFSSCKVQ